MPSIGTFVVAGQADIVGSANVTTLLLVPGANMAMTINNTGPVVTLNASLGTGSNAFSTLLVAGQNNVNANTSTSALTLVAGANMTITTNGVSNTITFAAAAGGADITSPQLTPAQITADTDDYAPTGYANAAVIQANTSDSWSLGGLVRGTANSVILMNVGPNRLLLNHDANTSAANNRFFLGEDQVLVDANTDTLLIYDFTSLRWMSAGGERKVGKGFFAGGHTGSVKVATADRCTYSTETTAAVTGANLSSARYDLAAAGNASKGFFAGGITTVNVATADRCTYSTETTAAVTGANLSSARYGLAAAGNALKGFFAGGFTTVNVTTADRCTYATETTAAVAGANLSSARYGAAAAGTALKGFFAGGVTTVAVATADRCTYSTETTAAVTGANLSSARYYSAAAGTASKGFFAGGHTGSVAVTTADRCTYSTETTAAVTGANLSSARYSAAAAGTGIF